MPLSAGQILNNRYRIETLLGQGGFGAVYMAWDLNLERWRALKENLDASPEAQRQFKREAQILCDLAHPNLPRVIDHFVIPDPSGGGGSAYLVMDFVEGEDLEHMLERNGAPLPEAQVITWLSQVCEALEYLHSQQPPVIHRDIKPANIKVTPAGKAVLVDFGIAKLFDPNLRTSVGARAYTSGYSPPEQYGRGATDAQSDVYALGATAYHLLTGRLPPDSMDIVSGSTAPLRPAHEINATVSPQVSAALERAMQLNRASRWSSVTEFKHALTPNLVPTPAKAAITQVMLVGKTEIAASTSAPSTPLSTPRTLPWGWIGIVGLLALVVIFYIIRDLSSGPKQSVSTVTNTALAFVAATQRSPVTVEAPVIIEAPTATEVQAAIEIPTTIKVPGFTETPTRTEAPTATKTLPLPSPTTIPVTSTPIPAPQFMNDARGVKMALVPAGEFQMGSENGNDDEKPVHTVYLDAFYIDVYEVTNKLYEQCVLAEVCTEPKNEGSETRPIYYGNKEFDDFPVVLIDARQAKTYCNWRRGGLPTEAQWEKAARGASDMRTYPWGDDNPSCTMTNSYNDATQKNCAGDTSQVGSYLADVSPYGVMDMAGNVSEWVNDWYQQNYYSVSPTSNPTGPVRDGSKYYAEVYRGGNYHDSWRNGGVSFRDQTNFFFVEPYIGFRCARSSPSNTLSFVASETPIFHASPSPLLPTTASPPISTNIAQSDQQVNVVIWDFLDEPATILLQGPTTRSWTVSPQSQTTFQIIPGTYNYTLSANNESTVSDTITFDNQNGDYFLEIRHNPFRLDCPAYNCGFQ